MFCLFPLFICYPRSTIMIIYIFYLSISRQTTYANKSEHTSSCLRQYTQQRTQIYIHVFQKHSTHGRLPLLHTTSSTFIYDLFALLCVMMMVCDPVCIIIISNRSVCFDSSYGTGTRAHVYPRLRPVFFFLVCHIQANTGATTRPTHQGDRINTGMQRIPHLSR